jgi:hypothetical protein
MLKKYAAGAIAGAVALTGLTLIGTGTASAKKAVLQGTLQCATGGQTTITPGLVLTTAQLPPPKMKDKKPKYVTASSGACTGTSTSGTTPAAITTLSGKAKGTSRVIARPASACNEPGRTTKTKITFNTGDKVKTVLTSEVGNYAFNPVTEVSTPFPPCGSDTAVALAFSQAHTNDRIETRSTGISGGKAYAGKLITTKSVTTETIGDQFNLSLTPNGVALLHGDPAFSTLTIG